LQADKAQDTSKNSNYQQIFSRVAATAAGKAVKGPNTRWQNCRTVKTLVLSLIKCKIKSLSVHGITMTVTNAR